MELDNNHELVDENLLRLLQRCKNLQHLTLNAIIVVGTARDICQLQSEKKISKYQVLSSGSVLTANVQPSGVLHVVSVGEYLQFIDLEEKTCSFGKKEKDAHYSTSVLISRIYRLGFSR